LQDDGGIAGITVKGISLSAKVNEGHKTVVTASF
jgi:hypothetical protein